MFRMARHARRIDEIGDAIGQSEYLDGAETNWAQHFWALTWRTDGRLVFE